MYSSWSPDFAKNRKNVEGELCLNVIIPFFIIVCCTVVAWCSKNSVLCEPKWGGTSSGGFRGDRGMHPPHQPKTNDFDRKISLHFEKLVSILGCIPPTSLNLTISAEKSVSISVKTFFFFFLETT